MSAAAENIQPEAGRRMLIVTVGGRRCALRLEDVAETLRPLPLQAVAGAPPQVLGLSLIRGAPVPVLDLAALAGVAAGATNERIGRFVSLRLGERRAALAVAGVIGVRQIEPHQLQALPPLLAASETTQALALLDGELALVLSAAHLMPDALWQSLETSLDAAAP